MTVRDGLNNRVSGVTDVRFVRRGHKPEPFAHGARPQSPRRSFAVRHRSRPSTALSKDGEAGAQRVTQGLNCSSFWSLEATVSASRRVGNLPTRTRKTVGAPAGGDIT